MLLSILIPSYNHEQFVLTTIQAAASIDIRDKEIIVIDDGSTDGSANAIREYIASRNLGDTVRLISRENRGLVKTLNEGLSLARGRYFYVVASDDIPIPDGIRKLVDQLDKNPAQQFVLGNALLMESEDQREFRATYGGAHRRFFAMHFEERYREMFLHYPQPILLQATVFRTSALTAIGGWREDIISDDFSLFLQMFSQLKDVGKDFAFQPDIMACFYRRHGANVSMNLERQFMTVEQALTELCPPEWRDAAYFRNCVAQGVAAMESGRPSLAAQFFHSTIAKVGLVRLVRTAASELIQTLTNGVARRQANAVEPLVVHEAAAARLDRPAC
jgi:glycosyltransferase involved in cell wall biosynthesis